MCLFFSGFSKVVKRGEPGLNNWQEFSRRTPWRCESANHLRQDLSLFLLFVPIWWGNNSRTGLYRHGQEHEVCPEQLRYRPSARKVRATFEEPDTLEKTQNRRGKVGRQCSEVLALCNGKRSHRFCRRRTLRLERRGSFVCQPEFKREQQESLCSQRCFWNSAHLEKRLSRLRPRQPPRFLLTTSLPRKRD